MGDMVLHILYVIPFDNEVMLITPNNYTFFVTIHRVLPYVPDSLTMKHIEVTHEIYS
jgi:hypothetical protein|tara:strand:- start:787 stop:957 length:171 start_codon:yes stop_codon:yes gene_type:complete